MDFGKAALASIVVQSRRRLCQVSREDSLSRSCNGSSFTPALQFSVWDTASSRMGILSFPTGIGSWHMSLVGLGAWRALSRGIGPTKVD